MTFPYTYSEKIWNAQALTATATLQGSLRACPVKVFEITTAAFSGTLDIQGRISPDATLANATYTLMGQSTPQTASAAQLSYTLDTAVYRYLVAEPYMDMALVMTRTAGSITVSVGGWGMAVQPGNANIGKVQPFAAIIELGLTELIDKDDTEVSQNDYSKSVVVALAGGPVSGEITQICVYATELGTGAVRANSGYLLIFDADPTVSAGDTALALADWQSCIAKVLVSDWISDTGGGMATIECAVPFHSLSNLYFVFLNNGTAFNDAAGDDEELHVNAWYRRES